MSWYLEVLRKYAVFNGRARRQEYWMFALVNLIVIFVLGFVTGMISGVIGVDTSVSIAVIYIYDFAITIPSLAVAVRRMHDTGRSGWWILVPIANLVFLCSDSEPGQNKYGSNPKYLASAAAV